MNIVELHSSISADIATQIQQVFFNVFGEATDEDFLERVNEKADLTVLLAYEDGELVGNRFLTGASSHPWVSDSRERI